MELNEKIKNKVKLRDEGWTSRNFGNYEIKQHEYSFGRRMYVVPRDKIIYENVQESRGIHIADERTAEELRARIEKEMKAPNEGDSVRTNELIELDCDHNIFDRKKTLYEIGFRTPKMLTWGQNHFIDSRGCDISSISVELGEMFGFLVDRIDLSEDFDIDFTNVGLIMSYHVLEHVQEPLKVLKKLHDLAEPETFFHVEVPIEPGMPRIRFAHMHEFRDGDLSKMLKIAGWKVLHQTHKTHSDGPFIDRCLVVKI